MVLAVKNPPANAGETRDTGSIPWVGKIPWRRKREPSQYSCLENSMDRGAWRSTVHRVKLKTKKMDSVMFQDACS